MLRRVAASLAGLAAILLILGGVPFGLWVAYGNPLPRNVSWEALRRLATTPAVDDSLFIHVVALVGWAAWLIFTLSVLAELVSQLSGRRISIPGLRRPQRLAAPLVTLLLAVFVAAPLLTGSGASTHQANPAPVGASTSTTSISAAATTAPSAGSGTSNTSATGAVGLAASQPYVGARAADSMPRAASHADREAVRVAAAPSGQHARGSHDVVYTVRPGDALMSIAEDHYGDQSKWRTIAETNEHLVGRHGVNFLEVGWKLRLPDVPDRAKSTHKASAEAGDDYTVRSGDTLSEIADDAYGSEHTWPRIYHANPDIADPDLIQVGEHLTIPQVPRTTAKTADHELHGSAKGDTAKHDTAKQDTDKRDTRESDTSKGDAAQRGSAQQPGTDTGSSPADRGAQAGQAGSASAPSNAPTATNPSAQAEPPAVPVAPATAPAASATAPAQADEQAGQVAGQETSTLVWAGAAASALLAVGVLGVISARRRRSAISRRPGRRLPGYTPQAEQAVSTLRNVSAPLTVAHLDLALRTLSAGLRAAGQPLPRICAIRLGDDRLDARLAEPAESLPPRPFEVSDDGLVWTLPADRAGLLLDATEANQVAAPYPSLVTLGTDEDGAHVLVDLETVAALSVDTGGDGGDAHAILAALAFELATASWADDLQLTIAGTCADLPEALGVDRARYVEHVSDLFDDLEREAAQAQEQLDEEDLTDARQGRMSDDGTDAWTPHILLIGHALTDAETHRLAEILTALPRIAVAAITTDPTQITEWALVATDPAGQASLEPLGLRITPQRLSGDAYAAVCAALIESQSTATEPAPWWDHDAAEDQLDLADDNVDDTTTIAVLHPDAEEPDPGSEPVVDEETADPVADDELEDDELARERHGLEEDRASDQGAPAAAEAYAAAPELATDVTEEGATTPPALLEVAAVAHAKDAELEPSVAAAVVTHRSAEEGQGIEVAPLASLPRRPTLQLLGEVTVENITGTLASGRTATELLGVVVFLYLHPGCSTAAFKDAFAKRTYNTDELVSRTRRWLGNAEDGTPLLPKASRRDGGRFYQLSDLLRSDWALFHELTVGGVNTAPTTQLVDALRLVRGRPLASIPPDLLSSVEPWREEATSTIVDAALVLGSRAVARSDLDLARWAVRQGHKAGAYNEGLSRLQIRIERLAGRPDRVQDLVEQLVKTAREDAVPLDAETVELLHEIRDGQRRRQAAR